MVACGYFRRKTIAFDKEIYVTMSPKKRQHSSPEAKVTVAKELPADSDAAVPTSAPCEEETKSKNGTRTKAAASKRTARKPPQHPTAAAPAVSNAPVSPSSLNTSFDTCKTPAPVLSAVEAPDANQVRNASNSIHTCNMLPDARYSTNGTARLHPRATLRSN